MIGTDVLGFFGAGLVLATFCMKQLVPLRALAITSNVAFALYGYCLGIEPVLVLHLILLPVNIMRLVEVLGANLPSIFSAAVGQRHPFKAFRIQLHHRGHILGRNSSVTRAFRTN